MGWTSVYAKEVNFYFNLNGGTVSGSGFETDSEGFLRYNSNYYTSYTSNIKHINSMGGKTFKVSKKGTKLVSGREWYLKNYYDGKYYFFSESKEYSLDTIFATLDEIGDFGSYDLYANWENLKITGVDMKSTSSSSKTKAKSINLSLTNSNIAVGSSATINVEWKPKGCDTEKITWTSSDSKIATVSSNGVVKGVKAGKVNITAKTSNGLKDTIKVTIKKAAPHNVNIVFNMNGGSLASNHGNFVSTSGNTILCDGNKVCHKFAYNEKIRKHGLYNYNYGKGINLYKNGYYIDYHEAWNTKADGTGKSYNQATIYNSNVFCDASLEDCTVTLYANWKKMSNSISIALIGNSKTSYGNAKYPKSKVSAAFVYLAESTGKKVNVTTIVKGGSTLDFKAKNSPYKEKIEQKSYDYVVLQEQTDVAIGDYTTYTRGAKNIVKLLQNQDANIYVRSVWPRQNSSYSTNTTKMINNAKQVAKDVNGTLINDAKAFKVAKSEKIPMYIPDNNHPSTEGAYLSAACIYKHIYNTDVSKIQFYYGISTKRAKRLLEIAQEYC